MHGWQDWVLGLGGFFFAASLWPTIRSKAAQVPLSTSLPTAIILAAYIAAEWTVHLPLAALSGVASSGAWFLIALLRRPRRERCHWGNRKKAWCPHK